MHSGRPNNETRNSRRCKPLDIGDRPGGALPKEQQQQMTCSLWDRTPAFFLILVLLPGTAVLAQSTGSLTGTVRDETGGLLPGATLALRGATLQRKKLTTQTNEEGRYHFSRIAPGQHQVEVELPGFVRLGPKKVRVAINQKVTLDFTLKVEISEIVNVESDFLVEATRSSTNSRVFTEKIDGLPLNGRNFVDLIGLVPGATPQPSGGQGTEISIFGERGTAISYLVDGGDNNDPLRGGPMQRFTQDSIQEFEVITTGYEAEFGRAQGGVVNIITRPGTNGWAGSGFLFFRNDSLDSSNVPEQEVPKLERGQWGGTLGGPIRRDRAFFFGSLEVLDETRGVNIDRSKIPSFALTGLGTPSGGEDFDIGPRTDGFTGLSRFDVTLNDENRFHVLFNRSTEEVSGEISSPIAGTIALPSAARTEERRSNSLTLRESWTVKPTTFLESTAKFVRAGSGLNLERAQRLEPVLLLLRSGFLQTGAPFGGKRDRDTDRFQLTQGLSHFQSGWSGEHIFKMGWDWSRVTLRGFNEVTNDVEYSAAFLASNQADLMQSLFERFDFQQAAARFFTLSGNPDGSLDLGMENNELGLFFQDNWRVHPELTLNLGLRYDYASLFSQDKNNLAPRLGFAWDPSSLHKTVIRGSFGLFFDRNLLSAAATVPELGGVFTRSAFDVALPRLGSDYTDSLIDLVITSGFPLADGGRTPPENPTYKSFADTLRADPLALYKLLQIEVPDPTNPPVVSADNVQALSGLTPEEAITLLESVYPGTDWKFFDVPGGSIVGDRVLSFFPRGPLDLTRDVSQFSDAKTPWTHAFNIGIEQQLARDLVLSVSYVRRRSRDLLTRRIINLFNVPPGNPSFGKTTDGGPRINQVGYDGKIDYDGLIVELRKRFSKRYSLDLSYTASRTRDNLLTGNVGSGFTHNNHPELDLGPSNLSAPHSFIANSMVSLPFGLNASTIIFWRTGSAFNPRGITDQDGDGLVDQRDLSFPRNSFRTHAFFNADLRIEKRFHIKEGQALGILIDVFNLTNQANVRNVNAVSGPDFGIPNHFFPGREIQIGLRYLFGG